MRSRICVVWPLMSWLVSAAVRPARKTRSPCTTARLMRGPGGWVMLMRRTAGMGSLIAAMFCPAVWPARSGKGGRFRGVRSHRPGQLRIGNPISRLGLVLVIDDALPEGVDAERHQLLVADDAEGMRPVRRQHHRHTGFERYSTLFAVEPGFAAPLD